jgi:hypothetical protein
MEIVLQTSRCGLISPHLAERVQSDSGTNRVIGAVLGFGQRLSDSNLGRAYPPGCQGPTEPMETQRASPGPP